MTIFKTSAAILLFCLLSSIAGAAAEPKINPASFTFAGHITDQQGRPIPNVKITASYTLFGVKGSGYIDEATSDAQGNFAIDRQTAMSGATSSSVANDVIQLTFIHSDFLRGELSDLHLFSQESATHLNIVLRTGRSINGNVVDAAGTAVSNALVEIEFANAPTQRRATLTDDKGNFRLNGLPTAPGTIHVLTTAIDQPAMTGQSLIQPMATHAGPIALSQIQLPPQAVVHELFGMKLVDVNPFIQKSFHLQRSDGVLILDPGSRSADLNIGQLQRGDQFWIVGDQPVKNVAEFEKNLLQLRQSLKALIGCRVVYCLSRPDFTDTNTQYMHISKADLDELSQAK